MSTALDVMNAARAEVGLPPGFELPDGSLVVPMTPGHERAAYRAAALGRAAIGEQITCWACWSQGGDGDAPRCIDASMALRYDDHRDVP